MFSVDLSTSLPVYKELKPEFVIDNKKKHHIKPYHPVNVARLLMLLKKRGSAWLTAVFINTDNLDVI